MMIYEVNLVLGKEIESAFGAWLEEHMKEMLTFDGFEAATLLHNTDETLPPEKVEWTVQYRVRDKEALERYFKEDAPRMREDGLTRFGGSFTASRKIQKITRELRVLTYSS